MKIQKSILGMITIMLLVMASGCTTASPTPDLAATIAVNVAVQQTMAANHTQTVLTQMAYEQQHPTETPTPQPTATSAFTPTPEKVTVTLSKDTYCRKGVFAKSPFVTLMKAGQTYDVLGVDPTNDAYYVADPDHTFTYCWLWGEFAAVSGDLAKLPVYTPQPMPTPTYTPTLGPDFSITFLDIQTCGTDSYYRFNVKNTGSKIWQSVQINLIDSTTGATSVHTNTAFVDYSGCSSGISESDLFPGESSNVAAYNTGQFGGDTRGHSVTAVFMLCQSDAFEGCQPKSISFVP